MRTGSIAATGAGAALILLLLAPIAWMVGASVTPEARLFDSIAAITPTTAHYRALFEARGFLVPIRNSLVVAGATTAIAVPIAVLCAFALTRLRMPGGRVVLAAILAVSMFPQISIVPPLYLALRAVGLLNTFPGIVLPYLTFSTPLAVWMLSGFFRQLPRDLEDAARLDGASRVRVLWDVLLPVAAPGIASTAILVFLYSWNEFLFAFSFTLGPERYTVPVAITLFRGRYQVPWGEIMAAAVVATVPVALIVLAFQRRIVSGLTAGATKG